MIRIFNILFLFVFFFSCHQKKDQNNLNMENEKRNFKLPIEVLGIIKSYYWEESKAYNTMLNISSNDTIVNLKYKNIPNDTDDYEGFLINIYIPLKENSNLFGSNPILKGDLNNDNIEELVVCVHTEGGWGGGNNFNQDIFVFKVQNENYRLLKVFSDYDISVCEGPFRVKAIKNNKIMGYSSCYNDNDPRCCPSKEILTEKGIFIN